jgi:hypothetical protein
MIGLLARLDDLRVATSLGNPTADRTESAIRSSEVDGLSLRFVISPRLNRRADSRLVHGSGHIVRALGARAGRVDLSGRLIVGGCLLMHDGACIPGPAKGPMRQRYRRPARSRTPVSVTSAGDVPAEMPGQERVIDPGPAHSVPVTAN